MRNAVESLGRIRAQGIALLLVTFTVGVLVGVAGERWRSARTAPEPPAAGSDWVRRWGGALPPMFAQLELSPEQQARIVEIMERGRPRTEQVLSQMLPRLRAVTDSVRSEIRAVLTPEQASRMDSLMAQMHRMRGPMHRGMRGMMGRPPPREP